MPANLFHSHNISHIMYCSAGEGKVNEICKMCEVRDIIKAQSRKHVAEKRRRKRKNNVLNVQIKTYIS